MLKFSGFTDTSSHEHLPIGYYKRSNVYSTHTLVYCDYIHIQIYVWFTSTITAHANRDTRMHYQNMNCCIMWSMHFIFTL